MARACSCRGATHGCAHRGRFFVKSEAALRAAAHLDAPWSHVGALLLWIPLFVRDFGYRCVASTRYAVFGKLAGGEDDGDSCRYNPQLRGRILDNKRFQPLKSYKD